MLKLKHFSQENQSKSCLTKFIRETSSLSCSKILSGGFYVYTIYFELYMESTEGIAREDLSVRKCDYSDDTVAGANTCECEK